MTQTLGNYLRALHASKQPTALLLGNGLGLSHPQKEFRNAFSFNNQIVSKKSGYQQEPDILCPEEKLRWDRNILLFAILQDYIKRHPASENIDYQHITQFFDLFTDIYSINYDLITYWVMLEANKGRFRGQNGYQVDGFSNEPLTLKKLVKRLEKYPAHRKVYYLHGAYHLYCYPENELYEKITLLPSNKANTEKNSTALSKQASSSRRARLIDYIAKAFNKYVQVSLQENVEKIPLIVMESKWHYKRAAISVDGYLEYAFKQFAGVEGDIFAYGCSFSKDDHLIEAMLKNRNLKNFHICIREQSIKRKAAIEKKIHHFQKKILEEDSNYTFPNINWVHITESEKHLIWEFRQYLEED